MTRLSDCPWYNDDLSEPQLELIKGSKDEHQHGQHQVQEGDNIAFIVGT